MEIKFRGKTEDGRWIYGYYVEVDGHHFIAENPIESDYLPDAFGSTAGASCEIGRFNLVLAETVGQFIGNDVEGKEIYVGDIIESCWDFRHKRGREVVRDIYRAEFDLPKLVGNFHDNPDLLEKCDG